MSNFQVGDIVVYSLSAYFKITDVKNRWLRIGGFSQWDMVDETSDHSQRGEPADPILTVLKIAGKEGVPIKGRVPRTMSGRYCRLASEVIPRRLDSLEKEKERLTELLKKVI